MKKLLAVLFVAASMVGVAHAQSSTTITQDTANAAKATCLSNGGTAAECQAAYDAYIQAAGTTVPNTPAVQTAQPSSGSGFTALAPIPGLTDAQTTSVLNENTLALFFNNLYRYLIGLAATLAVIEIVWAGLDISFFHKDAVSAIVDDKGRIYNAIFGLILVLSPYLVFSIINPSILNLSLNLPKIVLDIPAGGVSSTTPSVVDPTTGCTFGGTLLKTAACPVAKDAQAFAAACGNRGILLPCSNVKSDGTCGDPNKAVCESPDAGPYMFVDVSSKYIPSLVSPMSFSSYQPQVSSPSNPNSGADALQFAKTCTQDGGRTCISITVFTVQCTYTGTQPSSQNNKCYLNTINCIQNSSFPKASCDPSPNWKPIQ